jgi:hypothetical protein
VSKWADQKHLPRRQRITRQTTCSIGVSPTRAVATSARGSERQVPAHVVHLINSMLKSG